MLVTYEFIKPARWGSRSYFKTIYVSLFYLGSHVFEKPLIGRVEVVRFLSFDKLSHLVFRETCTPDFNMFSIVFPEDLSRNCLNSMNSLVSLVSLDKIFT